MERGGARGGTHIAGPLAARYRVTALDRPGHGYSERPVDAWPNPLAQAHIAHGLAQGPGLERPILVGHSWVGSLVLAYSLAYPGEAAGAVLLAGGTYPWEGPAPLGPGPAPLQLQSLRSPWGIGEGGLVARAASQVHRGERVR